MCFVQHIKGPCFLWCFCGRLFYLGRFNILMQCVWCKSTVPKDALVCLKCNRLTDKQAQIDKEECEHRQVTVTQTQNSRGGGAGGIFWGLFCFFILFPIGLIFLAGLVVSVLEVV